MLCLTTSSTCLLCVADWCSLVPVVLLLLLGHFVGYPVWATGSQTLCVLHAEDRPPCSTMRTYVGDHAAPATGVPSGLPCASTAPGRCAFQVAGAPATRAWLTCRCLAAVPQIYTARPAAQLPCPLVRPRTRAMLLPSSGGRSVQRWPRTRRSSDPLQLRPRRPCFRP